MPRDRKGPRLAGMEKTARDVGRSLDRAMQRVHGERIGFALLLFDFGPAGFATYVSNANRQDMTRALTEQIERMGGVAHDDDCPHARDCTCGKGNA